MNVVVCLMAYHDAEKWVPLNADQTVCNLKTPCHVLPLLDIHELPHSTHYGKPPVTATSLRFTVLDRITRVVRPSVRSLFCSSSLKLHHTVSHISLYPYPYPHLHPRLLLSILSSLTHPRPDHKTHRFVRCLYSTRCPQLLHRIGSPRFRLTAASQSPHVYSTERAESLTTGCACVVVGGA
jgi:hypothetical protein